LPAGSPENDVRFLEAKPIDEERLHLRGVVDGAVEVRPFSTGRGSLYGEALDSVCGESFQGVILVDSNN